MKRLLALLLLTSPSYASFTVVQSTICNSANVPVASQSCSFNSLPTVGNMIIGTCVSYNFSGAITVAVNDNQSNSWSLDVSTSMLTDAKALASISHAQAANASGTFTVTCTPSANDYVDIAAYEISGAATSSAFDVGGSSVNINSSSAPQAISAVTTVANDFVFACKGANTSNTPSAGSGYTLGKSMSNAATNAVTIVDEYKTTSGTGAQTADFSLSSPDGTGFAEVVATFKPGSGGGATAVNNLMVIFP